jgi:hypothetical protein
MLSSVALTPKPVAARTTPVPPGRGARVVADDAGGIMNGRVRGGRHRSAAMYFDSGNSWILANPPSRPMPLCFMPPNGARATPGPEQKAGCLIGSLSSAGSGFQLAHEGLSQLGGQE